MKLPRFPPAAHQRLWLACRVWMRAQDATPWVRVRGGDIRSTDPLPTFVELLARAAVTDCIAESCDGRPLGLLPMTIRQVTGLLSPSSVRRVEAMMERQIAVSEIAPRSPYPGLARAKVLGFHRT